MISKIRHLTAEKNRLASEKERLIAEKNYAISDLLTQLQNLSIERITNTEEYLQEVSNSIFLSNTPEQIRKTYLDRIEYYLDLCAYEQIIAQQENIIEERETTIDQNANTISKKCTVTSENEDR